MWWTSTRHQRRLPAGSTELASGIPSEEEIRAFAERTGNVDGDGNYTAPRARLALGAQRYAEETTAMEEHEATATSRRLHALYDELVTDFGHALANDMIVAATPAVIRREGLNLKEGTTIQ